jgi:acrylyl-CoA reductase (NADPH)
MELATNVAPFILRGVSLLGVDSVMCPMETRKAAWKRLETDIDRLKIEQMTTEIGFSDVIATCRSILDGQIRGRVAVRIGQTN